MYSLDDVLDFIEIDFDLNVKCEANVTIITTEDFDLISCFLSQFAELIYNGCLESNELHVDFNASPMEIRIVNKK